MRRIRVKRGLGAPAAEETPALSVGDLVYLDGSLVDGPERRNMYRIRHLLDGEDGPRMVVANLLAPEIASVNAGLATRVPVADIRAFRDDTLSILMLLQSALDAAGDAGAVSDMAHLLSDEVALPVSEESDTDAEDDSTDIGDEVATPFVSVRDHMDRIIRVDADDVAEIGRILDASARRHIDWLLEDPSTARLERAVDAHMHLSGISCIAYTTEQVERDGFLYQIRVGTQQTSYSLPLVVTVSKVSTDVDNLSGTDARFYRVRRMLHHIFYGHNAARRVTQLRVLRSGPVSPPSRCTLYSVDRVRVNGIGYLINVYLGSGSVLDSEHVVPIHIRVTRGEDHE